MMQTLWQDLRYAWRSLQRHTVLSLTVLATLTLGIGVNAAVFPGFRRPCSLVRPSGTGAI